MKMNRSFGKFQNENICKLHNLKNAKPREFWKIINSLDETAPLRGLFDFFKNINAENTDESETFDNSNLTDNINENVNNSFTEEEILKAVKNLKKQQK